MLRPGRVTTSATEAILETVARGNGQFGVAYVIRLVSERYPAADVRLAYWQLLSELRLHRTDDGLLSLP